MMTQTKRQEKTVALTHMEVLKLISDGHFWRGPCDCPACEDLRVKLAATFPAMANEFARRAASS